MNTATDTQRSKGGPDEINGFIARARAKKINIHYNDGEHVECFNERTNSKIYTV